MDNQKKTPNRLIKETSPYLLQHAYNPVDWYPWGAEAFEKARREDKPVFLSIGYSTCHWCHVMARESFEDAPTAELINKYFVPIKVDKEERPDIDSVYMAVCQAFTGGGGWPTSIFMTPDQKPFFAGTYFPKTAGRGMPGLSELVTAIHESWVNDRAALLRPAEEVVKLLGGQTRSGGKADQGLIGSAVELYRRGFDRRFGGFGDAPKFPAAHNLIFLMTSFEKSGDRSLLDLAEKTLLQMYLGGIFDHIGGGFCRYSTDRYYLVPHFEKMLYDNALLISAYSMAFRLTGKPVYRKAAEKTADYVLREMTSPRGGFYSAQDADSEGVEGKYYVFTPSEIAGILGQENGERFNKCFDITEKGNFEGKSIPNLLKNGDPGDRFEPSLSVIYNYRRRRSSLHLDDKILTSWNCLMIWALCRLYRAVKNPAYLEAAKKARDFIAAELSDGAALFVSFRDGKPGGRGFLDDYANYALALLALYEATLDGGYLEQARRVCEKTVSEFADTESGGFFLGGNENETLVLRPKDTYDGAVPSGNSVMAYVLTRLSQLTDDAGLEAAAKRQLDFMAADAAGYPPGYSMFLTALSDYFEPPEKITAVLKSPEDRRELPFIEPESALIRVLDGPTGEYPLRGGETTFYVCRDHRCLPPVNTLPVPSKTAAVGR